MQANLILQNFYNFPFYTSNYYENILSLKSVLTISSEYFLATSILTISIFFVLLPKLPLKYFNNKVHIFSFINYQLNFLAILILFFYCFICIKQYFLFLFEISTFNNSIFNDFTSLFAKLIIGFSSIIYLLFIQNYLIDQKLNYFEYYILILTSILGFCLLCCSNDLLTAYLAIELQGLSFYVLSSFKKSSNYSAESGVKYFIIGSFSTIIFLLGINLIYGISGSICIFDFKDLFVWVFSVNSFFLSFDNLPKRLEFFQLEKTFSNQEYKFFDNNFSLINLKTIFNNLLIFKNKVSISLPDSFYFINNATQEDNDFEEYLLENISTQMTYTADKINDSSIVSVSNKVSVFQLLFSEPRELVLSSMFQNLVIWFLLDIQNHGIKFGDYDYFSESLLSINSELELLNKFKYNWISIENISSYMNNIFGSFSNLLTENIFINDWSEFLAFRHLSESIDMALSSDTLSYINSKKVGGSKGSDDTIINNDNINFLLILKKFSHFGYINLNDSKFILGNINKIFENIQVSSNLNLIFSSLTNFQDYKDLSLFKCLLFSSVSVDEYNFYEKLSNLMIQFSSPYTVPDSLKNFNKSFADNSSQNILFASRAQRLLTNTLDENKQFLENYFVTFNKINSYFISVEDKWNFNNNSIRFIESLVQNNNLNYYDKRLSFLLFYLDCYYFKNVDVEMDHFLKIHFDSKVNYDDNLSSFSMFYGKMFEDNLLKISDQIYKLMFSPNDFLKFYNCEEFFSLFLSHIDLNETSQSVDWYLSYYLVYSDAYLRNVKLFYYFFDVVTNLLKFIEHEDFFENSTLNKKGIVSNYEKFSTVDQSLEEIVKRFELLKENSTLSICEIRFLISQITNILKSNSCNSKIMELLTNLASHMKNNFLQDNNTLYQDRAVKLKMIKSFSFVLSEIEVLVKKVNEIVLQFVVLLSIFYENNDDIDLNEFLINDFITPVFNIQQLFSTNFSSSLFYEVFNFLCDGNIYNFSLFTDIKSEKNVFNSDLNLENFKTLAIITNYMLFYAEPLTNSDGLIILPENFNYDQKINFLDFIISKINLLKQNFKLTRWEFEFLLKELTSFNFKDSVLKEKYREVFLSLKFITPAYLNNEHRILTFEIFDDSKLYEFFYHARQTIWYSESTCNFLSVKNLLQESDKNCETYVKILSSTFYNENVVKSYDYLNLLPNFPSFKSNNDVIFLDLSNNSSVCLVKILYLFPLFLDCLENLDFNNDFSFDTFLIELGLLLILVSLFLKLALTPFHLWSPDIYEGSPSSTTFFFVVISKISIFVFLLKICYLSFYSMITHWQFYSLFVALLSILLGSIAALKQRKIKSLLAYSSISNMGLILAAFSVGNFEGIKAVFYYFVIYIISGLSIWLIFLGLKLKKRKVNQKYNKDLGDFSLLYESNTVLAYTFVITIFTIAGIPPMVGFLAKISIFLSLIFSSMIFIAFISVIVSVISTFYYIRILKVIFFENLLIGKLFYPINSKINIVSSFLFFLMIFLFLNPLSLDFFTYKVVLFLNKSFY